MANIVCYELEDSPFFLRLENFMFYFSSKFYMNKFEEGYKDYIKSETLKLNVRYKMIAYADEMLMLSFYKLVEKRGFKVKYKGEEIEKDYYIDCILDSTYSGKAKE